MLLKGANVADPEIGNAGINLRSMLYRAHRLSRIPTIRSSVKLAGGIATVDTTVSNFDKFHFQIQHLLPRFRKRDGSFGVGSPIAGRVVVLDRDRMDGVRRRHFGRETRAQTGIDLCGGKLTCKW